jgi:regulation of enolase protein 1 (concanavalin A-like superfamily)
LAGQEIGLRLTKKGADLMVEYNAPGTDAWRQIRVAHWHGPPAAPLFAGLYACSPKAAGFRAEFRLREIGRL